VFDIFESEHWLVNHRGNSALPGYLIVGSKMLTTELSDLPPPALGELGPLLASTQAALRDVLGAQRVYIGRYGHMPGHALHFHIIPIYHWVEALFWQDQRYRALQAFADGPGETPTDGAELTLFVWREFCERAVPPPVQGPSVEEAAGLLRQAMGGT
jgi:diadenosine tetraphosphate (Ap4A) HIT family hydrolase